MQTKTLSRLMFLSWEIQRKPQSKRKALAFHTARAKALQAAWAILLHEDITVYHLVKKHSNTNNPNRSVALGSLSLFQ